MASPWPVSAGGLRAWEGHHSSSSPTWVPSCAGRAGSRGPCWVGGALEPPCKYTRVLYDGSKHICHFSPFSCPRQGTSSRPLPHQLHLCPDSSLIPPSGLGHLHPPARLGLQLEDPSLFTLCKGRAGRDRLWVLLAAQIHGAKLSTGSPKPPPFASITCILPLFFFIAGR